VTAGDYLNGFLIGTREALYGNDRQSMTITIRRVDARTIGALIALFERAVGLYASLIHINAYHQPGVEAGKKAAAAVLSLQAKAHAALSNTQQTATQIAAAIGTAESAETIYLILEHLAANGRAKITQAVDPGDATFLRL
jgi:glucose-6-phosphate isomerase